MNERNCLGCLVALVISLGVSTPGAAESRVHQSDRFAYSIAVPDGWSAHTQDDAPPEFVEDLHQRMARLGEAGGSPIFQGLEFDLLMQRDGSAEPTTAPYMLVLGVDWEDVGVPPDKVTDVYVGGSKGARNRFPVRDVDFREGLPTLEPGHAAFDTHGLQYVQRTGADSYTWMKYGRSHMLMLEFVPAGDDGFAVLDESISGSFRWDEDEFIEQSAETAVGLDETDTRSEPAGRSPATAAHSEESEPAGRSPATAAHSEKSPYVREGERLGRFLVWFTALLVFGGVLVYWWQNRSVEYAIPDDDDDADAT